MSHQQDDSTSGTPSEAAPRWQVLPRAARRVVGVLAEKAKTTPENYPLSLNALVNGCNQKSNRFPQMQLDEGDVEEALEYLRAVGAAVRVEGSGRVDKHRHLLYEWLGVDKAELAVMAELLLRGAQTLGELRTRAARMESIRGIAQLRPIVDSLLQKELLIYLTPLGRGEAVTHSLYQPQELDKIRAEFGGQAGSAHSPGTAAAPTAAVGAAAPGSEATPSPAANGPVAPAPVSTEASRLELQKLRAEVASLTGQVTALRIELNLLKEQQAR